MTRSAAGSSRPFAAIDRTGESEPAQAPQNTSSKNFVAARWGVTGFITFAVTDSLNIFDRHRRRLAHPIVSFSPAKGNDMSINFPKASAVRETLRAKLPHVDAGVRGAVLRSMIEAGHVENDLSPDHIYAASSWLSADASARLEALKTSISAADSAKIDPDRVPALNRIKAMLRRVGYGVLGDGDIVDSFKLDQVLAKSDESIESRIALKLEMGKLGLLPRLR
jgi:hypothetical protein